MSGEAQLLPGTLDLLILKAVSLGPLHGYGILLRIGQISGQALLVEQGALYPALFRLVRQGLLKASWGTSENNRRAKYYELTASGKKRLQQETDGWNRLGGQLRFREECREALGGNFIETLVQDLRYGIRVLRKSRGFTIVSIFTLALAICANAVVFGVINSLLLRQLNVPHPESLYALEFAKNNSTTSLSYPDYLDLRDRNKTFDGLIAYNIDTVGLDTGGNPTRTWIEDVSGN